MHCIYGYTRNAFYGPQLKITIILLSHIKEIARLVKITVKTTINASQQ